MKKEVSILIPTRFDSRYIIELCLLTIRKYTAYPYKIIIGDVGTDKDTNDFLQSQKDVELIKCPDFIRPKDYLARLVKTPYFIFLHDDVQILRPDWLNKRVGLIESSPKNGIVGVTGWNYIYGFKRFFTFKSQDIRFFPLCMLIRTETQKELDLLWGIAKGFDTGGIAYLQFIKQNKWKFIRYKFNDDIKHWGGMTWVMKEENRNGPNSLITENLVTERTKKINTIKNIIAKKEY